MVTCVCACGSTISSNRGAKAIESAVRAHQRQPQHRAWFALEQLAGTFVSMQPLAVLWRIQGGQRPA